MLRGGYGIFYANLNPALAQFVPTNLPEIGQNKLALFFQLPPPGVAFPFPDLSAAPNLFNTWAMKKDWDGTYTQQWNLNIQQAVGKTMVFEVGYVGNRALHVLTAGNGQELNPFDPPGGVVRSRYPAFGSILLQNPCCNANYNGLQASFKRQASAFTFGAHYTWSHAFDESTLTFASVAQDPDDLRAEYATADYDVRHNFVLYYDYQVPKLGRLPRWLGEGWGIRGITAMRSGLPVGVVCGCDSRGIGAATGRPDIVPGVPVQLSNSSAPGIQINREAFTMPAPGTFGNAPRNPLAGPAAFNSDFGLSKIFRLTETQRLEFRAEMFNIFNTPQFVNPAANLGGPQPGTWPVTFDPATNWNSATFGQSFNTINTNAGFGSNRQVQFALKYDF